MSTPGGASLVALAILWGPGRARDRSPRPALARWHVNFCRANGHLRSASRLIEFGVSRIPVVFCDASRTCRHIQGRPEAVVLPSRLWLRSTVMSRHVTAIPVLLAIAVAGCGADQNRVVSRSPSPECSFGTPDPTAVATDLDQVLADPERFAGRRVRLRAFLMNEFEDHGLYISDVSTKKPTLDGERAPRCDVRALVPSMKALWWDAAGTPGAGCNRSLVTIEGIFDPCEGGHMSLFSGGLHNVNSIHSE